MRIVSPEPALAKRRLRLALAAWPLSSAQTVLLAILAVACVLRGWSLSAGVPHAVALGEPTIVGRVLRILNTGDWNPHAFEHPTLVIYLHALVALCWFLLGAARGEWASLAQFDLASLYFAARGVTAGIGVMTVWVTHRMGRHAGGERIGLLAAAQLAILPIHVRESHVVWLSVPLTALTTTTIYLSMRLDRSRPWRAGLVGGLAAAARYSGSLAVAAVLSACLAGPVAVPSKLRASAIVLASAALAFLVAAPYVVLDLPSFLNTFAAHNFEVARARVEDPSGLSGWLEQPGSSAALWLPLAAAGLAAAGLALRRRADRVIWVPLLSFLVLFLAVLATYAPSGSPDLLLPVTPLVCVLAAVGIDRVSALGMRIETRRRADSNPVVVRGLVQSALTLTLLVPFGMEVSDWQREIERRDTREIAADWLKAGLPRGASVAVERVGPTHLEAAGFNVTEVGLLVHHPLEWYVQRKVEFLIVSSDAAWTAGYADTGVRMVDVPSLPHRPGPSIRVVRLAGM